MAIDDVGFVHLHVHSSYSLLEGALPIAKLAKLARADKMPALALTDTNNLYGALEFSEKLAGEGVQPIVGLQLSVDFGDAERARQARKRVASIVLLATTAPSLREFAAALDARARRCRVERPAAFAHRGDRRRRRRADRAHRRPGRPDR